MSRGSLHQASKAEDSGSAIGGGEAPTASGRRAPLPPPAPVRETLEIPPAPTVRSAFRAAFSGFYYNSLRLVPANIVWGAALLAMGTLVLISPGLALVAFLLVLPLPTAGLFRLAAMIQRGEPVTFGDALAWRAFGRRAIATGLFVGASSLVLGFNVLMGFQSADPVSWAFATSAFWGLVILWIVASALWPLLLDPLRRDEPATALVRLALIVILVKPLRYLGLLLALAAILLVSTVLVAALLTISMAFTALALAAYAIPAADRIEGRRTFVVTS